MSESEIRHPTRILQRADFRGLRFGSIRPTDIDGFVEFRNKLGIYLEAKSPGVEMDKGQEWALERACDAWDESGKSGLVLVVEHETNANSPFYEIGRLPVVLHRWCGHWREPTNKWSCEQAIHYFGVKVFGRDGWRGIVGGGSTPDADWVADYSRNEHRFQQ